MLIIKLHHFGSDGLEHLQNLFVKQLFNMHIFNGRWLSCERRITVAGTAAVLCWVLHK